MILCDFHRLITISDKIDVGPSKKTEDMKRFAGVVHRYQPIKSAQWADSYVRVLASQGSSKPNSKCVIYYFQ